MKKLQKFIQAFIKKLNKLKIKVDKIVITRNNKINKLNNNN